MEVIQKPQGGWECVLEGLWHFFGVPWEMLELSSRSSLGCPMKDSLEGQDKGPGAGMIILGPGYLGTAILGMRLLGTGQ